MPDDDRALKVRQELLAAWQRTALQLIDNGVPEKAVFETLVGVGLAGLVGAHGKRAAATILQSLVETIDKEVAAEAAAVKAAVTEAAGATRN